MLNLKLLVHGYHDQHDYFIPYCHISLKTSLSNQIDLEKLARREKQVLNKRSLLKYPISKILDVPTTLNSVRKRIKNMPGGDFAFCTAFSK